MVVGRTHSGRSDMVVGRTWWSVGHAPYVRTSTVGRAEALAHRHRLFSARRFTRGTSDAPRRKDRQTTIQSQFRRARVSCFVAREDAREESLGTTRRVDVARACGGIARVCERRCGCARARATGTVMGANDA